MGRKGPGVLVDISSVKTPILAALQQVSPPWQVVSFHPMAGSELRGYAASRRDFVPRPTLEHGTLHWIVPGYSSFGWFWNKNQGPLAKSSSPQPKSNGKAHAVANIQGVEHSFTPIRFGPVVVAERDSVPLPARQPCH